MTYILKRSLSITYHFKFVYLYMRTALNSLIILLRCVIIGLSMEWKFLPEHIVMKASLTMLSVVKCAEILYSILLPVQIFVPGS